MIEPRPLPDLVHRAEALATAMRFERSSIREIGRLLAVLAATRPRGRFAEIGTGTGVGSAWIAEAMSPEATFVTVESDADRAAAVARLFSERPNVRVVHGDWRDVLSPEAPFDLLFLDGGAKDSEPALDLVAPAGTILIDDLTPESRWPDEWRGRPDPVRELWLNDPRLVATELLTTPETAAILAVRLVT